ncbi:MAG: DUF927 domain-containing protein [Methylomonas sp.]|jgi:hypothetical protein|uniref:DUF927 domain-containing protein n=1 Tax=Methylomonas sp. TaxID=418 RepID=UPI0025D45EC2|nr:DUF927 domain-containing protein [Methylomonas sp.]MCK9608678.1 DUF927 domain-containing protein [Methylomonas sp.]
MRKSKFKTRSDENGTYLIVNGKSRQFANFSAKVVKETAEIGLDGVIRRYVTIQVRLKGEIKEFEVSHSDFEDLSWIGQYLGLDAKVDFHAASKATFVAAIIKASKERQKICKNKRLGYQMLGNQLYFVYHGGSIPADGNNNESIVAEVDGALKHCQFPSLGSDDNASELVRKILDVAKIMPNNPFVGTLLLAGVFRAVLNKLKLVEVIAYLVGKTGSGKTTAALIAQACFGSGFKKPPTSWESTPKSIELTALAASCIVLLIDDFTKVHNDKSALPVIENIIGAVGNGVSRGFALSSTQNSNGAAIEAFPIMTGESIPDVMIDSRKARTCFAWISSEGDFDKTVIGEFQKHAADGEYAKAMSLYIAYVLQNFNRIGEEIEGVFDRYRREAMAKLDEGLHARAPSNYADLMLGFHYFLKFCIDANFLTKQEAKMLRQYHSDNLMQMINMQPIIHQTQDIKHLVLVSMSKYIRSDQFSLVNVTSGKKQISRDQYPKCFIGWVDHDKETLYIKADCGRKLIANLPEDIRKVMSAGEKAFWKDAYRFGLLAEIDQKNGRNVVRKRINGEVERVYSMVYSLMYTHHDSPLKPKSKKAI